jgi:pyridoxamine 5'-phosphate oxidase
MADETKPTDYDAGTQAPDFTGTSEPFGLFEAWFAEAKSKEPNDPEAMALATVDVDGLPNVRMVLLKGLDGPGRPDPQSRARSDCWRRRRRSDSRMRQARQCEGSSHM